MKISAAAVLAFAASASAFAPAPTSVSSIFNLLPVLVAFGGFQGMFL